ncbi:hypothetical protein Ancab_026085 [Ancistrocladus abbreviatus]
MAVREEDSNAPEEFTTEQGIKQDEEIRKVQRENKARVIREGKELRKKWAERLAPRPRPQPQSSDEVKKNELETEARRESQINDGMLPEDIVNLLAAREKQVFLSDSDGEEKMEKKTKPKRERPKKSGVNPIILKDIAPAHRVENSLEFLKKRKLQEWSMWNTDRQFPIILGFYVSFMARRRCLQGPNTLVLGWKLLYWLSHSSTDLRQHILFVHVLVPADAFEDNIFIEWFMRRYEMKLTGDCTGFSFGFLFLLWERGLLL